MAPLIPLPSVLQIASTVVDSSDKLTPPAYDYFSREATALIAITQQIAAIGGITELTGDVTAGPGNGSQAATIAAGAVSNIKLANMVQSTIKGRAAGAGTGQPQDLTATLATAILDPVVGDSGAGGTKGLVPAAAAGDAAAGKFLKADGTFKVPGGGGNVVGPGGATDSDFAQFDGATGLLLKDGGLSRTTDGTLAANSDLLIPTEKAVKTAIANAIAGVNPAVAVQAATVAILPNSPTYNNGASGIGAFITTLTLNATLVIDGYTPALNDRVLVKTEASGGGLGAAKNGVYLVTQVAAIGLAWILTRALDYDMPSDINNTGAIPVVNGTVNASTSWLLTSAVATVGTDALTYILFTINPSTIVTTTGAPASGNLTKFSGATSVTNGDISGDATTSGTLALTLAASGVAAATYGDASNVPQIAVDAKGRITSAVNVAIAAGSGPSFGWVGDGSDGPLTYDGTTTVLGMAPVAGTYTLTRDILASSITVNATGGGNPVVIKTNNFAIFCTGTLTNNGSININGGVGNAGGNASSSAGGAAGGAQNGPGAAASRYPRQVIGANAGTAGGAGATGAGAQAPVPTGTVNSTHAIDATGSSGNNGVAGGKGGDGTSGVGGALRGGQNGGTVASIVNGHNAYAAQNGIFATNTSWVIYQPPGGESGACAGGSGGGGDGANAGGGGGGSGAEGQPGGMLGIFAQTIANAGTISANGATGGAGGNGFTPTLGNTGGGGGGAGGPGGSGGIVWLVYRTLTGAGTITASAGSGGAHGTKGLPHGTGTNNAADGTDGPAGRAGAVIQIAG